MSIPHPEPDVLGAGTFDVECSQGVVVDGPMVLLPVVNGFPLVGEPHEVVLVVGHGLTADGPPTLVTPLKVTHLLHWREEGREEPEREK